MTVRAAAIPILVVLLTASSVHALPKGLDELHPAPIVRAPSLRLSTRPDIRELPPSALPAASAEELAVEVGTHVGRVIGSWSEGTSVPLLGPVVRGVVGAGRTAYRLQSNLESRYGLLFRPVGREGVAVMMRRRF